MVLKSAPITSLNILGLILLDYTIKILNQKQ
jgi:hypothetical protein